MRSTVRIVCSLFVAAYLHVGLALVLSEDWPHWRGPHRSGVVNESSGWERGAWPIREPLWTSKIAVGGSGPIVVGNRLYTMGWEKGRDFVYCLDASTGREIWKQSYACPQYGRHAEGDKQLYSGPSSCPSFDATTGYLLTLSADGDLNCWDTEEGGKRVWSLNFYDAYQVPKRPRVGRRALRDYGYTTAPLVWGDTVIVEVGDDEGNLMGFSIKTGKRLWTSQSKDPAGHAGGLAPIEVDGLPCVTLLTINNLLVARLDKGHEGETLVEYPWVTDFANSIATPAVHKNSVIITSAYNQYAICRLDITRAGAKKVWTQPYASGVCTPVIHKGHVYWCWRGMYCLQFDTGKPIWRGGKYDQTASCIATSDDRLIVWAKQGDLALIETASRSPKKYTELSLKPKTLKKDVWPHIVLAGGRLYCKDRGGNFKCFKL